MSDGVVGRALELVEQRTGWTVERSARIEALEESDIERRHLGRELEMLAYTALDYSSGNPHDLTLESRRTLVQKIRVMWMKDPQAGAAVEVKNEFTFGRGVPTPKAKDPAVQKVIDGAWEDPANRRILTSLESQFALGVDLCLQSNVFFLLFDDGDDGRVKVSLLDHDTVRAIVSHPDDRFNHLWYVSHEKRVEWDFKEDAPKVDYRRSQALATDEKGRPLVRYYDHWANVEAAREEAETVPDVDALEEPPEAKRGKGKVYHLAVNRTSEMKFGHPSMERTLRWHSAWNRFMEGRVDMMVAAAKLIAKRQVDGTPSQLQKLGQQALTRRSELAMDGEVPAPGPKNASIVDENESLKWEPFNLNSGGANSVADAQQLRAQISAAYRLPQAYFGDAANSSLATATSLELPILKMVEAWQEMFAGVFRWFTDRAIARAVEVGILDANLTDAELNAQREQDAAAAAAIGSPGVPAMPPGPHDPQQLSAAYGEDQQADEELSQRNLSYEFKMPNPLQRALTDIITAVMNVAKTFDPQNVNPELSRVLLALSLEELGMDDVSELVDRIFPPGQPLPQPPAGPTGPEGEFGPGGFGEFGPEGAVGADGQRHTQGNAYGAPQRSRPPEQAMEAAIEAVGREATDRALAAFRARDIDVAAADAQLADVTDRALERVRSSSPLVSQNGHGGG